jgi:hypothetical protein
MPIANERQRAAGQVRVWRASSRISAVCAYGGSSYSAPYHVYHIYPARDMTSSPLGRAYPHWVRGDVMTQETFPFAMEGNPQCRICGCGPSDSECEPDTDGVLDWLHVYFGEARMRLGPMGGEYCAYRWVGWWHPACGHAGRRHVLIAVVPPQARHHISPGRSPGAEESGSCGSAAPRPTAGMFPVALMLPECWVSTYAGRLCNCPRRSPGGSRTSGVTAHDCALLRPPMGRYTSRAPPRQTCRDTTPSATLMTPSQPTTAAHLTLHMYMRRSPSGQERPLSRHPQVCATKRSTGGRAQRVHFIFHHKPTL